MLVKTKTKKNEMLDMIKEIEVCYKHRNHVKGNEIIENKLLSVNVFYILCGHW